MKIEEAIKQKKFKSSYQKATINLIYTSNWLNDQMKQGFKPYDITSQQYNVLRILRGKHPDVCNAGYIKEVMLDKTPDLTRLIDRLLKKKLVTRETCEQNRRRVEIKITEEGLKLIKKIEKEFDDHDTLMNGISEKEAELLSDLLDKIRE